MIQWDVIAAEEQMNRLHISTRNRRYLKERNVGREK